MQSKARSVLRMPERATSQPYLIQTGDSSRDNLPGHKIRLQLVTNRLFSGLHLQCGCEQQPKPDEKG